MLRTAAGPVQPHVGLAGRRRLDTHFLGIQKLGASFNYDAVNGVFKITASHLEGTYMLLDDCFYSRILDESVEVLFIGEDTVVVDAIHVVQKKKRAISMRSCNSGSVLSFIAK